MTTKTKMNQRTWPDRSDAARFSSIPIANINGLKHYQHQNHHSTKHTVKISSPPSSSSARQIRFCSRSSPSSTSTQGRDFANLPDDVLTKITGSFTLPDLRAASLVCRSWRDALRPLREAMVFLRWGKRFKHGRGGVRANREKALDSFLKGAARGSTLAMVDAGLVYWEMGRKEEAIDLYRRAAELGVPAGQCNLGISYLQAEPPNLKEAIKWFYLASIAGHVRAQYQLALCLHHCHGVDHNLREAGRWYLKAAEGGYVRAMYNISLCYSFGEGLVRSHRQAKKWMKRAADHGHSKAQFEHGLGLFSEGEMMKAVVYLELATRAGETAATHVKNVILQQLSATSRDRVTLLADNWRALPSSRRVI